MDPQVTPTTRSRRSRLFLAYAAIAFAVSWAIEIPLALKALGIVSADIPFAIHYLAAFGPFIAGILLTWRENGSAGLKHLLDRATHWRVGPVWWIVAVSPVLLFLIVSFLRRITQSSWIPFSILDRFDFLPDLGPAAIFLWLATYGFGEEVGWRGYLLPRLQRDRSAWSATVILWVIWTTWHAPSFFYLHTASSLGMLIGFLVGVLAGGYLSYLALQQQRREHPDCCGLARPF